MSNDHNFFSFNFSCKNLVAMFEIDYAIVTTLAFIQYLMNTLSEELLSEK